MNRVIPANERRTSLLPRPGVLSWLVALSCTLAALADKENCWWVGTEASDPAVASSWYSNRLPGNEDYAKVNDGADKPMKISTGEFNWGWLCIGDNQARTDNLATMIGGTLNLSHGLIIGNGANSGGTFTLEGGTIVSKGASQIAPLSGTRGTFNMTGGTFDAQTTFTVGGAAGATDAIGTFNLSGGEMKVKTDFYIGSKDGTKGTVNMTGGTLTLQPEKSLAIGVSGEGVMNVSGSSTVVDFQKAHIYLNADRSWVAGKTGSGVLTLSDGATLKDFDRFIIMAPDSKFICRGGVLKLFQNRTSAIFTQSQPVYVGNGGITFITDNTGDAADTAIEVGRPFFAEEGATSGGFVKKGPGVLKLAAGNTWLAGPVDIQEGKVIAPSPDAFPGYATQEFKLAEGAELELGGSWSPSQVAAIKALPTVLGTVTQNLVVEEDAEISENLTAADVAAGTFANPKTGKGALKLTGQNDFGGEFRVNDGTLIADFGQGLALTDHLTLGEDNSHNNGKSGIFAPISGMVTSSVGAGGGSISFGTSSEAGFAGYVPTTIRFFNDASRMLVNGTDLPRMLVFNTQTLTNDVRLENAIDLNGGDAGNFDVSVNGGHAYLAGVDFMDNGQPSTRSGSLAKKNSGTLHMPASAKFRVLYSQGGTVEFPEDGVYEFVNLQSNNSGSLANFGRNTQLKIGKITTDNGRIVFNAGSTVTSGEGPTFTGSSETLFSNATYTVTAGDIVVNGGKVTFLGGTVKDTGTGWVQAKDSGELVFDGCIGEFTPAVIAGRTSVKTHPTSKITICNGAQMTFSNLYVMHGDLEISGEDTLVKATASFKHGDSDSAASASGPGSILITGGRVESSGDFVIGMRSGSVGTCRIEGGTVWVASAKSIAVGNAGDGTLEVAGGLVDGTVANGVALLPFWQGRDATYAKSERGMLRLLGGEMKVNKVYCTAAGRDTCVEFDGGKLTLLDASQTTVFQSITTRRMGQNGGEIDTGSGNYTLSGAFEPLTNQTVVAVTGEAYNMAPAFVKSGSGKLTFVGANTHSCGVEVKDGTLALKDATASLPNDQLVRLSGGTLDLAGGTQTATALLGTGGTIKNGTLTLTDGIYPGGVGVVGTMTVALETAALAGTVNVDYDEATASCDKLLLTDGADLSNLTLDLAALPAKLPSGTSRLEVISGTNLVGKPTLVNVPAKLVVSSTATGVRVSQPGLTIIFR